MTTSPILDRARLNERHREASADLTALHTFRQTPECAALSTGEQLDLEEEEDALRRLRDVLHKRLKQIAFG